MVNKSNNKKANSDNSFNAQIIKLLAERVNAENGGNLSPTVLDALKNELKKQSRSSKNQNWAEAIKASVEELSKKTNKNFHTFFADTQTQAKKIVGLYNDIKNSQTDTSRSMYSLADDIVKPLDNVINWLQKNKFTGMLTKMFGFDELRDRIHTDIVEQLQNVAFKNGGKVSDSSIIGIINAGLKQMLLLIVDFGKFIIANPLFLALGVLAIAIGSIIKNFSEMQKSQESFRKSTGLTGDEAKRLEKYSLNTVVNYSQLGVTMDSAYKAAASLTNEYKNSSKVSETLVAGAATLEQNIGLASEESAKLFRTFTDIGNLSDQQSVALTGFIKDLSKASDVAPAEVMKDIANSSKEIGEFLHGDVKQAAIMAVKLRQIGLSLKDAAKVSEGLLDFDTSIEKELYAGILLNKQLDFSRAREKAFEGDIEGATSALLQQIGSSEKFNKLNVIQKKAVADATGLEVDQISSGLKRAEAYNKLSSAEKKTLQQKIAALKNLNEKQGINLELEVGQQVAMKSISNAWDTIANTLSRYILPVVLVIANTIASVLTFLTTGWGKFIGAGVLAVAGLISILVVASKIKDMFTGIGNAITGALKNLHLWKKSKVAEEVGDVGKESVEKIGGKVGDTVGSKVADKANDGLEKAVNKTRTLTDRFASFGNIIKQLGKDIGASIKNFFQEMGKIKLQDIVMTALALGTIAGALYLFSLAMKSFTDIRWDTALTAIGTLVTMVGVIYLMGKILSKNLENVAMGALAMILMAGAIYIFGKAMQEFINIKWQDVGVAALAIVGLSVVLLALGALMLGTDGIGPALFIAGALAIVVLAGAIYVLGKALQEMQKAKIEDSLGKLVELDPSKLFEVAGGITAIGVSLAGFGAGSVLSGIGSAIGNFLGGDIFKKLQDLAAIADPLNLVATALNNIASGLQRMLSVDPTKLGDITDSLGKVSSNGALVMSTGAVADNTNTSNQQYSNKPAASLDDVSNKLDILISLWKDGFDLDMDSKKMGELIAKNTNKPHIG